MKLHLTFSRAPVLWILQRDDGDVINRSVTTQQLKMRLSTNEIGLQIQSRPRPGRCRHTSVQLRHSLFRIDMHYPSNFHLRLVQVSGHRRRRFHLHLIHRSDILPPYITTTTNSGSRSNSTPRFAGPRSPAGKHHHKSSRMGIGLPRTTTPITRPIPKTILPTSHGPAMARLRPRSDRSRHRSCPRLSDCDGKRKRNHYFPGRRSHWCD